MTKKLIFSIFLVGIVSTSSITSAFNIFSSEKERLYGLMFHQSYSDTQRNIDNFKRSNEEFLERQRQSEEMYQHWEEMRQEAYEKSIENEEKNKENDSVSRYEYPDVVGIDERDIKTEEGTTYNIDAYSELIAKTPNNAYYYYRRGTNYVFRGDIFNDLGEEYWESAEELEKDGDFKDAKEVYALAKEMYLKAHDDYNKAMKDVKKSRNLNGLN